MEGRHCFGHLTIEENLLTGAFTRATARGDQAPRIEMVYDYFPRLKSAAPARPATRPAANSRCAPSAGR
jgi:ABC-type branched-subunit amino acid transport system ATPase component